MGHKKAKQTSKAFLENASLPTHGKTYTVVSHKEVMDHTSKLLAQNNLKIINQSFRSSHNARVAQGIYHLSGSGVKTDQDLGMMFAWTNSYDKSTRFQCGIGANVLVCSNGIIQGDLANYGRKHTGTANADIALSISSQISKAKHNFDLLIDDKDKFKSVELSIKKQSELLGRLFVEEKLLDTQQMSIVKSEIEEPTYNYGVDPDTAWMFYNHVTHAFKQTHPRTWMTNQSKFHKFMSSELLSNLQIQYRDTTPDPDDIEPVEEILNDDVGPNVFSL
tara:strand:- start:2362 stop:3192 length:831 start_codon:yes stop_codon:yes gene_type:complete